LAKEGWSLKLAPAAIGFPHPRKAIPRIPNRMMLIWLCRSLPFLATNAYKGILGFILTADNEANG
jgi:hypothetical protein